MPKPARYTFGDNEEAAGRLKILSKFFNPFSQEFVRRDLSQTPETAVDLGCGPGFSTRMLWQATQAPLVVGVDRSHAFLTRAKRSFPAFRFLQTSLLQSSLPLRADALFMRFLLSHIPDPLAQVNRWSRALNPSGLLFVDELEGIETEILVFREYLEVQTFLVGLQGVVLFPGPLLCGDRYDLKRVADYTEPIPVENATAASWFYPNTTNIWKSDTKIQDRFGADRLDGISEELRAIKNSKDASTQSVWTMRRLVLER